MGAFASRGDGELSQALDALQAVQGPAITARRFVPSDTRREGEIRIVAGEWGPRVQLLLYTKSLGRALRQMRQSETSNWPESSAWHIHSVQFLSALDDFRVHLRQEAESVKPSGPQVYRAMIEFVADPGDSRILFYDVELTGEPDSLQLVGRILFRELSLAGNYVPSNQFLMVQEAFEAGPDQTEELLRPTSRILTKD